MSHLLISSFNFFTKKISGAIGVTINNNYVDLIKLKGSSASPRIIVAKRFELDNPAFESNGFHKDIIKIFSEIKSSIRPGFSQIQIALPDPLFSIKRFELDEQPRSKKTQNEYVHWKFSKLLNNKNLVCNSQLLDSNNHCLLGIALDKLWINQTTEIFKEINLHPTIIDPSSSYLLRNNKTIKSSSHNKAIVVINDNYWTMILSDKNNQIIHFTPQWEDNICIDNIIASCTRQIKSITNQNTEAQPKELFITDSTSANQIYAIELNDNINEQSSVISLPSNLKDKIFTSSFSLNPINLASGVLQ